MIRSWWIMSFWSFGLFSIDGVVGLNSSSFPATSVWSTFLPGVVSVISFYSSSLSFISMSIFASSPFSLVVLLYVIGVTFSFLFLLASIPLCWSGVPLSLSPHSSWSLFSVYTFIPPYTVFFSFLACLLCPLLELSALSFGVSLLCICFLLLCFSLFPLSVFCRFYLNFLLFWFFLSCSHCPCFLLLFLSSLFTFSSSLFFSFSLGFFLFLSLIFLSVYVVYFSFWGFLGFLCCGSPLSHSFWLFLQNFYSSLVLILFTAGFSTLLVVSCIPQASGPFLYSGNTPEVVLFFRNKPQVLFFSGSYWSIFL